MNPASVVDDDFVEEVVEKVRRRFSMKPKVAIAGFGNSGKSSLFNAIYGEKVASVSMKTDETTPENMSTRERFGIDFTDTPGFGTEKFAFETVATLLNGQHVVVHVLNGTSAISKDDNLLHDMVQASPARAITVVNKVDLLDADEQAQCAHSVREKLNLGPTQFLFVSAKRGTNLPALVERITDLLPEAMQDAFVAQQRADLALKERRIRKLIYSKATLCGIVAAVPIPIADIFVLTPIQIAMVTAIGYFHGVDVTKKRAVEFIAVVAGGVSLREAARQVVKLIPGWGSLVSAAIAAAGTVALGEAANAWFKSQMKMAPDELREIFKKAAAHAKEEYQSKKQDISPEVRDRVAEIQKQLKAGRITEGEMLAALGKMEVES